MHVQTTCQRCRFFLSFLQQQCRLHFKHFAYVTFLHIWHFPFVLLFLKEFKCSFISLKLSLYIAVSFPLVNSASRNIPSETRNVLDPSLYHLSFSVPLRFFNVCVVLRTSTSPGYFKCNDSYWHICIPTLFLNSPALILFSNFHRLFRTPSAHSQCMLYAM